MQEELKAHIKYWQVQQVTGRVQEVRSLENNYLKKFFGKKKGGDGKTLYNRIPATGWFKQYLLVY